MTTDTVTIDARSDEEKRKESIGIFANCLISLGQASGMNDQFNRDVWRAAELFGLSKLDLLRLLARNTPCAS